MGSLKAEKAGIKAGQLREPGIMTLINGQKIDLANCTEDDIDIVPIAWGLGRTLRYGGHIREDYTVAHHSVVMSYCAPEGYRKEALLHDAAEGYIGDIIWPFKCLFPEVREFEHKLLAKIMKRYDVPCKIEDGTYVMSPVVKELDMRLMEHESFDMGIRPGIFHNDIEQSWLMAATAHEQYWFASSYAFLQRFDQLFGTNLFDLNELTKQFFPEEYKRQQYASDSYALDEVLKMEEAAMEEKADAESS